jgi:hypothetical protein
MDHKGKRQRFGESQQYLYIAPALSVLDFRSAELSSALFPQPLPQETCWKHPNLNIFRCEENFSLTYPTISLTKNKKRLKRGKKELHQAFFITLALIVPSAAACFMLLASSRESTLVKYLNQTPERGSSISIV